MPEGGRVYRLLILDDEPAVASTLAFIAEDFGFEVESADNPAVFFDLLTQWRPTHIAVDLVMPQMDGVEILRALANDACRARIVVTSGMGRQVLDAAMRTGRERGLDIAGVLPKPFMPETFRDLLSGGVDAVAEQTGAFSGAELAIDAAMIDEALEQRAFRAVFQPQVTREGRVHGFEALVRWRHAGGADVYPTRFIPLAETHGRIRAITSQVFDAAVAWLRGCGSEQVSVAVNLSAMDIEDIDLADSLAQRCGDAQVRPERVTLELTETGAMRNPANALDVLTRLRMKGFRLAIDDFGTGYSSMSQLARLPFSEIKVDRSFVATMLESHESLTIVRTIIDLAENLGMQSVAEGVENEATAERLRELGCDLLQGYHVSRPMEADAASAWLASH